MAYADNRGTRFSPASVSAAAIVNGAFLAVLVLGVPDVTKIIPGKPITFINLFRPPVPTPADTNTNVKPDKKAATVPQTVTTKTAPVDSDNDLSVKTGFTPPVFPPEGFGTITEPPIQPPVHNPVEIGAKLNPRYAGDLQPSYPPAMLRQEIEGAVTVRVLIGTDGRVKQIEPVHVSEADFLKVTRDQALRKWRFTPATRDGVPVESWREMTVRFEMPG
jgi:periplasmic protein TonB